EVIQYLDGLFGVKDSTIATLPPTKSSESPHFTITPHPDHQIHIPSINTLPPFPPRTQDGIQKFHSMDSIPIQIRMVLFNISRAIGFYAIHPAQTSISCPTRSIQEPKRRR